MVMSALLLGFLVSFIESPWPRYALTVRSLSRVGSLPVKPAQFLDWAHTAGLVRLTGIGTQFRHRDLQTHLSEVAAKGMSS